ncbi:MAG: cytidine deaminase [Candidatus Aenigmarchaeota archaeon]|nr:cytidine deaminase [Candidatus Aenigmarchaeota archaeon]
MTRPDWDCYFLNVAREIAQRATCISRLSGAVIVKDKRIIATGYNGWAAGMRNCSDMFHLPDKPCPRLANGCKTGEGYGNLCKAIHAEQNALLNCREDPAGATLYLYSESMRSGGDHFVHGFCLGCLSSMLNAKITKGVIRSVVGKDIKEFVFSEEDLKRAYLERKV